MLQPTVARLSNDAAQPFIYTDKEKEGCWLSASHPGIYTLINKEKLARLFTSWLLGSRSCT